jgi:hypothetical protein
VMPCGLVERYQSSGGTCCLHVQGITVESSFNIPRFKVFPHLIFNFNYLLSQ